MCLDSLGSHEDLFGRRLCEKWNRRGNGRSPHHRIKRFCYCWLSWCIICCHVRANSEQLFQNVLKIILWKNKSIGRVLTKHFIFVLFFYCCYVTQCRKDFFIFHDFRMKRKTRKSNELWQDENCWSRRDGNISHFITKFWHFKKQNMCSTFFLSGWMNEK